MENDKVINDLEKKVEKEEIKEILNIKKEDLYNFNIYLASLNKNLGTLVVATFVIVLGIYGICTESKEKILFNAFYCILGILGYLYVFVFMKLIIKNKINKLKLEDLPPVEITLNSNGILYKFYDEQENEGKEFYPFSFKEVSRAVITNDYIYIHMIDKRTVLLVPMKDLKSDSVIEYLKEKLSPEKRYFDKRKVNN